MKPDTYYTYQGPDCHVTLHFVEGKKSSSMDVQLSADNPIKLPSQHPYVQGLLALNRLVSANTEQPATTTKGAK